MTEIKNNLDAPPLQQARTELSLHESTGSNYIETSYADNAYELAWTALASATSDFEAQEAKTVLVAATESQAKVLAKQGSKEDAKSKYMEALSWTDEVLATADRPEKTYTQSRRGTILYRLGEYKDSALSFEEALNSAGKSEVKAEILLRQHHLFSDKASPYFDLDKAIQTLDEAQSLSMSTGNHQVAKYAERYKLTLLIRSKRLGSVVLHALKARKSLWAGRKELAKRARKLK